MRTSYIKYHHIISSLGFDSSSNFENVLHKKSGIKKHTRVSGESFYSSIIDKEQLDSEFKKIGNVVDYTVLEKLMILSIHSVITQSKIKISAKTGLIIATTKGNIDVLASDTDFKGDKKRAYLSELGNEIKTFFGFKATPVILSNACVSGVLAVSAADRLIKSGTYDDILVVGGDLVTEFIVSGFTSFQAISDEPCRPYSKNRKGVTIGEAIACVLMSSTKYGDGVRVLGSGSCNDANHISGPSRTGEGLFLSVNSALKEAKLTAKDIDYISAHGTATNYNDEMEAIAFRRLEMLHTPLNSLKGYYGHTLGASGLLEIIIGIEQITHNKLVSSYGFDELGVSEPIHVLSDNLEKKCTTFLKTASGFGGVNSAVVFKKI